MKCSKISRQWQWPIFFLTYALLMFFPRGLFAGAATYTHVPGKSAPVGFHNIPAKPSSQVLSHVAFKPDLEVYQITFEAAGGGKESERVIIKVKNIGKAASPATRVSAVLTRGDGTHDKHSWAVRALKVHETTTFKWRIRTSAGNNTVNATVRDSHNRANNTLEKTTFAIARNAEKFVHRQALKAEGARRALAEKKARGKGALAIRQITFDDHRAKKGNASWVVMRIENTGGAVTPTTPLKVEIQRADGRREQKIFRIRPLMPGKATRIEGFFRMVPGENTLRIKGVGPAAAHNLTTFAARERCFSKTHYFRPPRFQFHAGRASLSKNAARMAAGREKAGATVNPNVLKGLSRAKHIHAQKPMKISTYDTSMARFLFPQKNAVIAPNRRYVVEWAVPETDSVTRFELRLKSDSIHFPGLILARNLDPSARSYNWNVGNIPAGHYYTLEMTEKTGTGTNTFSVPVKIDTPHLQILHKTVLPFHKHFITREIRVYAKVLNTGSDTLQPFYSKVTIVGPKNFVSESRPIKTDVLKSGKAAVVSMSFFPQIPGEYHAIYTLDYTHRYLEASEIPVKTRTITFQILPLPDLLLTINKVTDGVLAIDRKHFHIKVKNVGYASTPATKVYFTLSDQERKEYDVPALQPGNTWKHEFTKKWQAWSGGTGEKQYTAVVDPENRITEIDKGNNRVSDHFHIYRAGEPMPRHTPIQPKLIVTKVCGLPTSPITPGTSLSFLIRLKCVSPDRIPFRCTWGHIIIDDIIYEDFVIPYYTVLYPGETFDYYSRKTDFNLYRVDRIGQHTFKLAINLPQAVAKHPGYDQMQTLFERDIVVQESVDHNRTFQEVLASKNPLHSQKEGGKSSVSTIHPLTVLSPGRNTVWTTSKTYQVAWTGEAAGPFAVTLIPKDHPDAPIQIANNVTDYAADYKVKKHLAAGLYRVRIQSPDGWGMSSFFNVTGDSKPNLKVKAVSVTNEYSGNPQIPYTIRVQALIENQGGYQTHPFTIQARIVRQGKILTSAGSLVGPMLDQQTILVKIPLRIYKAGLCDISVIADSGNDVVESNEEDNVFLDQRYSLEGYADLRLACRLEGRKLHFTVKNCGDESSQATFIRFKCVFPQTQLSASGWHREGSELVAPEVPVKMLRAGGMLEMDGPALPFSPHGKISYTAIINPERNVRELCYDNNIVTGVLSAAPDAGVSSGWWKTSFGVEDLSEKIASPNSSSSSEGNSGSHIVRKRIHLLFVIWNKSEISVTPEDQPVVAMLHITQGRMDKTFTYKIPVLFSNFSTARRDTYRVDKRMLVLASQGNVSYHLFLKREEGHDMVLISSGEIAVNGD